MSMSHTIYGTSVCMHSHHGSGAVIVSSRKTGFVNFGVSRDKRVKRKRSIRSVAAIAVPIERGYLKRTAGGTACVNNHGDSRGTRSDGSGHPAAERTSTTTRDGDDDTRTRKRKRKQSERGKRTQHADVLHSGDDNFRSRVGQVSQCPRERRFEAWRQFVMEWEPKLRTRYVGLLMNVLEYKFRDDFPTKLAAFERTIHDYENQSTKTVDDDIKIGVTMLGMEDMRVKEHLIRNSVRITSWNQMREEILEITRTQQYIDSQPMPMQLGANPKSKGKGKESKGKGKGKDIKGKDKAKDVRNESSKKVKSDVLLLQQNRPREGRVLQATERSCRGRKETGGSIATSTRRNIDRAVTVLTPRRS